MGGGEPRKNNWLLQIPYSLLVDCQKKKNSLPRVGVSGFRFTPKFFFGTFRDLRNLITAKPFYRVKIASLMGK